MFVHIDEQKGFVGRGEVKGEWPPHRRLSKEFVIGLEQL